MEGPRLPRGLGTRRGTNFLYGNSHLPILFKKHRMGLWACSSRGTILDKKLLCCKRPSICDPGIRPCSVAASPPGSSWHGTLPPSLPICLRTGACGCSEDPHSLARFKNLFSSHPIDSLSSLTPPPTFLCPLSQPEVTCVDCHLEP